jgi:hypothetical protein
MRRFFLKRGVDSTTAIIAETISAHSVHAAPAALATSVTAVAITKGVAAASSTSTLIKSALKLMTWTKAKSALTVASAILALGTGVTLVSLAENGAPRGQSTTKGYSSVMGGTHAGRLVKGDGDVAMGLRVQDDTVVLSFGDRIRRVGDGVVVGDHFLTVEPNRLLLDGKELAKIPISATAVDIGCTNHTLSVMADKSLVLRVKMDN